MAKKDCCDRWDNQDANEQAATDNFENWHADEINTILATLDVLRKQVARIDAQLDKHAALLNHPLGGPR